MASREYAGIYHMSANGEFRREEHIPVLKPEKACWRTVKGFMSNRWRYRWIF